MNKRSTTAKRNITITLIALAVVIIAAGAVIVPRVLLPHYDLNINNAAQSSTSTQNGTRHVVATLSAPCNAAVENGVIMCEGVHVTGMVGTNRQVNASVSGNVSSDKTSKTTVDFTPKQISYKQVVIRTQPIGNSTVSPYTISVTDTSNAKTVLSEVLNLKTIFTSKDLALINKVPNSASITAALKTIGTIDNTCTVTEANDVNNELNKKGGYTAAVYFSDNRADLDAKTNPYSDFKDTCDEGASAGGEVEVYATAKDAATRASYLSDFTGVLGDGDDTVYGTSVVRVSNEMTATQIASLKQALADALTK